MLQKLETYPKELQGKLDESFDFEMYQVIMKKSKILTQYPRGVCGYGRVAEIPLIVYQTPGGGFNSIKALQYFKFRSSISNIIQSRLKNLPSAYQSIHIRNTDRQTDYMPFFNEIKHKLNRQNVLLCSDDAECIDIGKEFFDKSNIITLSDIPHVNMPLHFVGHINSSIKRSMNINMLTDLIGLACSSHIYTIKSHFHDIISISGFAWLAKSLQKNPQLIKQLLHG